MVALWRKGMVMVGSTEDEGDVTGDKICDSKTGGRGHYW